MEDQEREMIWGRHSVLAALRSGQPVHRILFVEGARGEIFDEIFRLCREIGIPYDMRARTYLDGLVRGNHQGIIAYIAMKSYAQLDEVLSNLDSENGLLLFLDRIQDPQNLGAIMRTALATGVDALIIPKREACGLTASAVKAAAGAAEYVPVCRVDNMQKTLQDVGRKGLWLVGLDSKADQPFTAVDYRRSCGIVIGNEGKGLRRMVAERCDFLVSIPMNNSTVASLNASVATGVALYEVFRQRTI